MQRGLKKRQRLKIFALLFIMLMAAMILDCQLCYPETVTLFEGERFLIQQDLPYSLEIPAADSGVLSDEGTIEEDYGMSQTKSGYETTLKLFGLIPVRTVDVKVEPQIHLAAGGNTVGIKIFTEGLLCVGTQSLRNADGKTVDVAREQDIRAGDILLRVNEISLSTTEQLGEILEKNGGDALHFIFLREDKKLEKILTPVQTEEGYKLGLWVRDSTAGIGTLTYFNPQNGNFGALGHPITDADTGTIMPVSEGNLLGAQVVGVQKGKPGEPGELKGVFKTEELPMGDIYQNGEQGVFGILHAPDAQAITYPIASKGQVQEGNASILANVAEQTVEEFRVEIQKVARYHTGGFKDMVIRITDERLLDKTGGIVQGMSGSPIIQNGKLIGAVTHVFVNDPTRGYGIFIENMLSETEKIK